MRFTIKSIIILLLTLRCTSSLSQTLPVGTPVLEEAWRRKQIKGESDINASFMVRPIYSHTSLPFDSLYYTTQPLSGFSRHTYTSPNNKTLFKLLPATIKQQYNSHHPYGWNDGSMVPAAGYQAQLSAGVYAKAGPLSVQLQPEFVYAQNKTFPAFPENHRDEIWSTYYHTMLNSTDQPERFGNKAYVKLFPGQSSIRLNYKKLSLGASTENLWWGPGIRNSLIMSNNAPGFAHLTFNTTAPVRTGIGSFEGQVVSGTLKNSNILPPDTGRKFNGQRLYTPKNEDDRYLNGMVVTWQPKWTKGLHLGFTRVFYLYKSDIPSSLDGYFPVLGSFFKSNTKNEDEQRRDQMLSFFFRLILPKESAEIYGEFGRNDHSQNLRDFLLEPEHSRAYIIGARKIFEKEHKKDLELFLEFTQLQLTPTTRVREQNSWYAHHQVRHGYTNRGQVIGAGIGSGSNSQTIGLSWLNGAEKFGLMLERIVRNNDFYYPAFEQTRNFGSHWVDVSLNLNKNWIRKHFTYTANLSLIRSLNYQWRTKQTGLQKDASNIQASFSAMYLF